MIGLGPSGLLDQRDRTDVRRNSESRLPGPVHSRCFGPAAVHCHCRLPGLFGAIATHPLAVLVPGGMTVGTLVARMTQREAFHHALTDASEERREESSSGAERAFGAALRIP